MTIESAINELKKKRRLPLMNFGDKQVFLFSEACKKVLLGGNQEATRATLQAIIDKVVVYEDKLEISCSTFKLLSSYFQILQTKKLGPQTRYQASSQCGSR